MFGMRSVISQFQPGIMTWVDRCFLDPEMVHTLTWKLYTGHETAPQEFSISAIEVGHDVGKTELEDRAATQQATHEYIIREKDLPSGVTVQSLTKNDRIVHGSAELAVSELDKTLEFVIYVKATGNQ